MSGACATPSTSSPTKESESVTAVLTVTAGTAELVTYNWWVYSSS